jgi:hypothetical protein
MGSGTIGQADPKPLSMDNRFKFWATIGNIFIGKFLLHPVHSLFPILPYLKNIHTKK